MLIMICYFGMTTKCHLMLVVHGADGVLRTAADLQGKGLRNGDDISRVYSLFDNHGSWYGYSVKEEKTQTAF